jgi:CheY-like chemotaxis protein
LSNHSNNSRTQRILCAEDNPHDRYILGEAFENIGLNVQIDTVTDGEKLLQMLRTADKPPGDGSRRSPGYDLLVLDANLPCRTGLEVLSAIHSNERALPLPVVVVSSYLSEPDKGQLETFGVRAVLTKPMDFDQYIELARTISTFLRAV